jgi:folate-binding protein YgfZ
MAETAVTHELDAQYRVMREGAGFLDRSERGKVRIAGAEAAEYLQGQLTNEVEGLEPGQGAYAALLDRKGHVQADMRVLRLGGGEIWLDLEPEATEPALKHLRTYSIGRELEITDVTGEWAITSLIGPAAPGIAGVEGLSTEHAQRDRDWGGVEVLAVATDLGLDLVTRAEQAEALSDRLVASGAEPVSAEAAEILRIESGRPRFGIDFGPEHMPAEAGIVERAVSFEKGCYIGQEPVARLHYRGRPNRRLVGLRLGAAASPGAELTLGDREVGRLGSFCLSPASGAVGLAILRREAEIGDSISVGEDVDAEVAELPFV